MICLFFSVLQQVKRISRYFAGQLQWHFGFSEALDLLSLFPLKAGARWRWREVPWLQGHLFPSSPAFSSPSPKSFNTREVWDGFVAKAWSSGIQIPNWAQSSSDAGLLLCLLFNYFIPDYFLQWCGHKWGQWWAGMMLLRDMEMELAPFLFIRGEKTSALQVELHQFLFRTTNKPCWSGF